MINIDLLSLSYEELRKLKKSEERDEEINKRILEKHFNPPIGWKCVLCGFLPCTLTEAATHIMEHQHKGENLPQ